MHYYVLPRFLQVELTYKCNSRCSFCYNPHHKSQPSEHSIDDVLKAVDEYRLAHVQLIGGEVTTLRELPSYLDALAKTRWKSIVTNGRILRSDIKGLVDEIYLSLHGDASLHEELTQARNSFSTIIKNIEEYASWGVDVNSDTVLTKFNSHKIGEIAELAKKIGMKRIFVNIFQPEGIGSQRPDFSPSITQIRSAIDQLLEVRDEGVFDVHFGTSTPFCLDERLILERLAFRCGAGEWFGSIDPSGEFRICNHSTRSYGNVVSEELGKIWHSRKIDSEYRSKEIGDPTCRSCSFRKECLGGCRIDEDGLFRVDPIVARDRSDLLTLSKLSSLKETFDAAPFSVSG